MSNIPHYVTNQAAVTSSKIVAKAVLDHGDHYRIIVIFQLSTRLEFYWIFRARSPRSARRSWKYLGFQSRERGLSFDHFVYEYGCLHKRVVLRCKVSHKRMLKSLTKKTEHESIFGDWNYTPGIQTFDLVNSKLKNGRMGRRAMMYR